MRSLLFALIGVLVASCSPRELPEKILTKQERTFIRQAVEDVAREDLASLSRKLPPELAGQMAPVLPAMRRALPPPPHELSAHYTNVNLAGETRTAQAIYEVKGRSGWASVDITVQTSGGRMQLAGLHIQPLKEPLQRQHAFRLSQGGPAGWTIIGAMLAALGVTVAALFRIWRSGLFHRRWRWTIGALIGLTTLKLSWGTSDFTFQPIAFQLFSASAFKQLGMGPWQLGVSLPLVALIALFRRRPRKEKDASAEA